MIKLYFVLRRRPDMTPEQFREYWKTVHGPLVAKVPGLQRYVQHHVMSVPRPDYADEEQPIDGIVETWWESQEAAVRASQTPEFAAVIADEMQFMGRSNRHVHALMVAESISFVEEGKPIR